MQEIIQSFFRLSILVWLVRRFNGAYGLQQQDLLSMLGGQYLIAQLLQEPLQNLQNSIRAALPSPLIGCPYRPDLHLEWIRKHRERMTARTSQRLLAFVEATEYLVGQRVRKGDNNGHDLHMKISNNLQFLDFCRGLFTCVPAAPTDVAERVRRAAALLETYGNAAELREKVLMPLISRVAFVPVFLSGSHGVGKTRLVKSIAELSDLPLIGYSPPENPSWMTHVNPWHMWDRFDATHVSFIAAAAGNNPMGCVLLIDEIDKILSVQPSFVRQFLRALDHGEVFYDDHLGIDAPVSHVAVVATSNVPMLQIKGPDEQSFGNGELTAMQSRVFPVSMPDLSAEQRVDILRLKFPELTQGEQERLIAEHVDKPGVRELLFAAQDTDRKRRVYPEVFAGTEWA